MPGPTMHFAGPVYYPHIYYIGRSQAGENARIFMKGVTYELHIQHCERNST